MDSETPTTSTLQKMDFYPAPLTNMAKLLGKSKPGFDNVEFWIIGEDVYRCVLDAYGKPESKRWECSIHTWNHFRSTVFKWVDEIYTEAKHND
jgi:hypothetical protein